MKTVQDPSASSAEKQQKIVPFLWYDTEAVEAAHWYVTLFEHSEILHVSSLSDTPSGQVETVDFTLAGLRLSAMSAGPHFSKNPSISLMVNCDTTEEVDCLYEALSVGGTDLMPLGEYPFSARYAWIQDRYGLNWQLFATDAPDLGQRIRPCLLFAKDACGKAEEALSFYPQVFGNAEVGYVSRYDTEGDQDDRARIQYAEMALEGLRFVLMDHGAGGEEAFNEAFSFMVLCRDQEELDTYWNALTFDPAEEQCGWLKDRFGVSWQIVPESLDELLSGTAEETARVTAALLEMGKLDIAALEAAKEG